MYDGQNKQTNKQTNILKVLSNSEFNIICGHQTNNQVASQFLSIQVCSPRMGIIMLEVLGQSQVNNIKNILVWKRN